jgi:hypothetical protein
MDPNKEDSKVPNLSSQIYPGCPFLGVREDSETHFATSSPGNYCHKVNPPEPVLFDHQESFCLGGEFLSCPVFSNDWTGPLPTVIRGEGPTAPKKRKAKVQPVAAVSAGLVITETDQKAEVSEQDQVIPKNDYVPLGANTVEKLDHNNGSENYQELPMGSFIR